MYKIDEKKFDDAMLRWMDCILNEQNCAAYGYSTEISFSSGWLRDQEFYKRSVWNEAQELLQHQTWRAENIAGADISKRILQCLEIKMPSGKKQNLTDWHEEDIFDYIPPQKTNQIFTPRWVVEKMVDELEAENPGCFDDPNKTFADLYMKSGLYITEIVKRLFRSEKMKALYPDDDERVRHILRHQVYGMAPTRIIYLIATNYILGFDDQLKSETTHFVQADAAAAAKDGTLDKLVKKHFG